MSAIIPKEHIITICGQNFRFLRGSELIFAGDFHCGNFEPTGDPVLDPVINVALGHRASEFTGVFLRPVGDERPIAIMEAPPEFLQADATKAFKDCRHEVVELMITDGLVSECCEQCKAFRRQGKIKTLEFHSGDPLEQTRIVIDWSL